MKRHLLALARFGVVVLAASAITWSVVTGLRNNPDYSFVNLFSYYTIQSNIIVILVLTAVLIAKRTEFIDRLRGAATLYIVITGVIYHLLLANVDVQLQTLWINLVLHTITPIYVLLDWLLDSPAKKIPTKRALIWLAYPAAYAAYSLVRGEITGWYPYPFMNAEEHGYLQIAINCIGIVLVFMVLAAAVAWLPRIVSRIKKPN